MKKLIQSTRGITLIELMAAAVIIGIVSAMAVPKFNEAFERIHFRSANRDIVSTMRLARSNAITDKEQYGVYFDPESMAVLFFKDISSPGSFTYDAGDSIMRADTLPAEITYLGTGLTGGAIIFVPNGSARFTGGGNIITMATTESLVAVQVHNVLASTGRIQSVASYY